MATSTVENYLKVLHRTQQSSDGGVVPTGRLAAAMNVVPGTATSMAKALADAGLARYEPRAGVKLTPRGEQLALNVLRRHRLLELFLVQVLGLDWAEVHVEADRLEHAVSDAVLARIDAVLGHPTVDPHGDPIPTATGRGHRLHEPARASLADCPANQPQRVARVLDQDAAFLRFVDKHGLMPGATVTVDSLDPAAGAVRVRVTDRPDVSLGVAAAAKILVEPPVG